MLSLARTTAAGSIQPAQLATQAKSNITREAHAWTQVSSEHLQLYCSQQVDRMEDGDAQKASAEI
jgi:hypothetical protein